MKRLIHFAVPALLLAGLLPGMAHAASFGFQPETATYPTGRTFTVSVQVNASQQAINAVSGDLTFPADVVQVVSVSKTNSIVSLWVQDPTYSNTNGTIRFEGAILNPGFQGNAGNVLTITFRAVGGGVAPIRFGSGAILANDGLGTNVVSTLGGANYSITQTAPVVVPTTGTTILTPTRQVTSSVVVDPGITSDTHPAVDIWSKSMVARFSWHNLDGATAVQYGLDRSPTSTPGTGSSAVVSSINLPLDGFADDGAYYFHLRFQLGKGWSQTYHRKILVDRVPPESFEVSQIESSDPTNPRPELRVDATDSQSGIDHIEVIWDGGQLRVAVRGATTRFLMPALKPSVRVLNVRVVDRAGNGLVRPVYINIVPLTSPKVHTFSPLVGKKWPWAADVADQNAADVGMISGTTIPGQDVVVTFTKSDTPPVDVTVSADDEGFWKATYPLLYEGSWFVHAITRDARGAESEPTDSVVVHAGTEVPTAFWVFPWVLAAILAGAVLFMLHRHRGNVRITTTPV